MKKIRSDNNIISHGYRYRKYNYVVDKIIQKTIILYFYDNDDGSFLDIRYFISGYIIFNLLFKLFVQWQNYFIYSNLTCNREGYYYVFLIL